MPGDGQSLYDLTGQPVPPPSVDGAWLVPPPAREFEDPAVAAFSVPRRTPHPVGCFTEPVRLGRPLEDFPFSRTYVRATADPGGPFEAPAEGQKS